MTEVKTDEQRLADKRAEEALKAGGTKVEVTSETDEQRQARVRAAAEKPGVETTTVTTTTTTRTAVPVVKHYRLKKGAKHNHNGKPVQPGDVIPLTEQQALSFADKFEDPNGPETSIASPFGERPITRLPAQTVAPLGVHDAPPKAAEDEDDPTRMAANESGGAVPGATKSEAERARVAAATQGPRPTDAQLNAQQTGSANPNIDPKVAGQSGGGGVTQAAPASGRIGTSGVEKK